MEIDLATESMPGSFHFLLRDQFVSEQVKYLGDLVEADGEAVGGTDSGLGQEDGARHDED